MMQIGEQNLPSFPVPTESGSTLLAGTPETPAASSDAAPVSVVVATERVEALERLPYLMRLGSLHGLLAPVAVGTALAWWQLGQFNLWILLLSLMGGGSLYLAANSFVAYFDHQRSQANSRLRGQPSPPDLLITPQPNSIHLTNWGDILSVGWLLVLFGGLTGLWLAYVAGWPVLFFSGLSTAIVLAYALPPIQFGYRVGILGEVGLFIAFGYLPTLTSFYAQTGTLTQLPMLVGIPLALLVTLISLNYELISWRQDWRIHKRTSAVSLPPRVMLDISMALLAAAFVGILILVGISQLPAWALLSLASLPLALGPYARVQRHQFTYGESVQLLQATITTLASTGLLLVLALWLDKGL